MRRPKRAVPRQPCAFCEGSHDSASCPWADDPEPRKVPLETPSANGVYAGPVPVRVLPQGVSGEDAKGNGIWRDQVKRYHANRDKAATPRTHCKNGHPWTPENTYTYPRRGRPPALRCRICTLAQVKRYDDRRNAERRRKTAAKRKIKADTVRG